jgi:hypothetical protein
VGVNGKPLRQSQQSVEAPLPFARAVELREAINKDIAAALNSNSQNAGQQLRNLTIIKSELDRTIKEAPFEATRKLYDDYIGYYRDTFAPKFLRGANRLADKTKVGGDPAIRPEKLFGEYLQPNGALPMARYLKLYGEDSQAMNLMREALLDRYTTEVLKRSPDKIIDPQAHAKFMDRYSSPLSILERNGFTFGNELKSVEKASTAAMQRAAMFDESAKSLAESKVLKIVTDKFGYRNPEDIINSAFQDPRRMAELTRALGKEDVPVVVGYLEKYIRETVSKNGVVSFDAIQGVLSDPKLRRSYEIALGNAYGQKGAAEHIAILERAGEAAKRLEAAPPPARGESEAHAKLWQDFMSKKIGVSIPMLHNLLRSVLTSRTSIEGAAGAVGSQAIQTIKSNIQNGMYKEILENPDSAKLLMKALEEPVGSPSANAAVRAFFFDKAPRFLAQITGLNRAPELARYTGANILRSSSEPSEGNQ